MTYTMLVQSKPNHIKTKPKLEAKFKPRKLTYKPTKLHRQFIQAHKRSTCCLLIQPDTNNVMDRQTAEKSSLCVSPLTGVPLE